jgi:hypothetical protein
MMPGLCPADQYLSQARPVKPASEDQKLSGFLSNRSDDIAGGLAGDTSTPHHIFQQEVRERSPKASGGAQKSKNFDVLGPSREQTNGSSQGATGSDPVSPLIICYGADTAQPNPRQRSSTPKQYRVGGTKRITITQAIHLKAAVNFAELIALPLNAHLIIHWVGTDAGDDPNGELFAKVREGIARWLRRRGIQLTGIWFREKQSGGQAEVEHAHLIFHLPIEWLDGAKLIEKNGGVAGCAELLQFEAALHCIVSQYAGRPEEYAVKLKIPTDGGLPGSYNGRSYDGLYALKGGGPEVWKLFQRIRKEWRKPQGLIFGKRCGTTQNIGPAPRRQHPAAHDYELQLVERVRRLRKEVA